ncbi:MAG: hypothetical protein M3463_15565 [Verrucomicrobiota bacterium]|nr:hypothetical protein [Verrucomicrobiota bacterium]
MKKANTIILALCAAAALCHGGQAATPNAVTPPDKSPALTGEKAVTALEERGRYQTLKSAFHAARYRAEQQGAGVCEAVNPAHALDARFTAEGTRLTTGDGGTPLADGCARERLRIRHAAPTGVRGGGPPRGRTGSSIAEVR